MDIQQPSGGRHLDGFRRRTRASSDLSLRSDNESDESSLQSDEIVIDGEHDSGSQVPSIQPPSAAPKPPKRKRHLRRNILIIIALIIISVLGFIGYRAYSALHNIIQKHIGSNALNSDIDLSSLKGEGSGRVNILVMGIGGAGHDGPDLTDTMIVYSIDPKTYDIAAISVPRDLYVKIPGYGFSKLNAANSDGGPALSEKVISTVLGVDINYYMIVDFSGFKQAVDAVGGVDITVPTALYDKTYPCDVGNGICPYSQPAGNIHMSGTQALKYARCRHNDPGVGNCGNDYGRSARQQQVIGAIRAKALSIGTLTNPAKITGLLDTVGGHVKTDLQLSDMKKLAQLATKIDTSKIVNKVLDDEPDNYLVGGTNIIPAAGYIYVPKAGNFDYSDIHDFVKNIFVDRYITSENAKIEVDNGSGVTGLAGKVVSSLSEAHYNVAPAANAASTYPHTIIYDYTNGKKPYTIKYLEQRFGVSSQKATPTPTVTPSPAISPAVATPEIRIILGSDYQASN